MNDETGAGRGPGSPPADPTVDPPAGPAGSPPGSSPRRPAVERLLLALVALGLTLAFATLGALALAGGEVFLGAMGLIGALMTLWVGALTALRS